MDTSIFIGTWWSLVPPLLAIILALVTKEVYSSLFIGVAVGALLYTGFHPWNAFNALFAIMKDSMNLNILIFDGAAWNDYCTDVKIRRFSCLWKMGRQQDQVKKERNAGNHRTWNTDFCG